MNDRLFEYLQKIEIGLFSIDQKIQLIGKVPVKVIQYMLNYVYYLYICLINLHFQFFAGAKEPELESKS